MIAGAGTIALELIESLPSCDVVVVPKMSIQRTDDALELIFSRGIYRVLPLGVNYQFGVGSSVLGP